MSQPVVSRSRSGRCLAIALVCFCIGPVWPAPARALPTYEQVRAAHLSTEGVLLDRNGTLLHEMRVDPNGRRLDWATLEQVSPALLRAVVRAEDKRFYEHAGVDWLALTDAALDSIFSSKPRGASTLSMQVAAMLEQTLRARSKRRTVGQKWDQIQAARELERTWSKRQILEAYLNLSTFRGELQGVAVAARALFDKEVGGVDDREALLLAVLLRGPNAKPDLVVKRACALAQALKPPQSCDGLAELAQAHLIGVPNIVPRAALAPHVARELLSGERRRVTSTLDAALQALVVEAAQRQLAALAAQNVADAAVLVADNRTGEVLAYLGNAGADSSAPFVDGVRAPRQAGSTLKPFLYQLAIEQQLLTAASLLDDSPLNIVTPGGLYVPQNYDHEFKGLVSLRTALAASLNVPAVRTLTLVGLEPFVDRLRALGFDHLQRDGEHYGYALALGSAEVTLWQLVNAYRALANGGVVRPLRLTPEAVSPPVDPAASTHPRRVLDALATYIVDDILADRAARSPTFGLDNPLAPRFWAAVKTGTSKDMRDNWCVGFTSRYTVGVWVGNFDGSPMWDVSGVSGAAPLWLETVSALHRGLPSSPPADPDGVVRTPITFEAGLEPAREELFLPGTELAHVAPKGSGAQLAAIAYPADGQIIAIDPDIPAPAQRIEFRTDRPAPGTTWRLNGQPLPEPPYWRPLPGRWHLGLHDATGRLLHEVWFEVRGSALPPASPAPPHAAAAGSGHNPQPLETRP